MPTSALRPGRGRAGFMRSCFLFFAATSLSLLPTAAAVQARVVNDDVTVSTPHRGRHDGELIGWAANANFMMSEPAGIIRGTVVVPPSFGDSPAAALASVSSVSTAEGSDFFLQLREALKFRPPHGWLLEKDVAVGDSQLLRSGSLLAPDSVVAWESSLMEANQAGNFRARHGPSPHLKLNFSEASFCVWNGLESLDPCMTLTQPVMHFSGGAWSMDIWYIPYFPKAKSDHGEGSSRTAQTPLLSGERVTLGSFLTSSDEGTLYYQSWWSLTARSVPFTIEPATGRWRSNQQMVVDDCWAQGDTHGEGGKCANCYMTHLDATWSTSTPLAGVGFMHGTLQECQQACCKLSKCRAVNVHNTTQECYLLGAFADADTQPDTAGWSIHVRGQLLISFVQKNWTDLNGNTCDKPAAWAFGFVMEAFSGVDTTADLPRRVVFEDVLLSKDNDPKGKGPTWGWTTWLSDTARLWGISLDLSDQNRTVTLSTPAPRP